MNGFQIEATQIAIDELRTRAEAAEARCARLEGIVRRVVNCQESQHLPTLLMIKARAALQQETVDPPDMKPVGVEVWSGTNFEEPEDSALPIDEGGEP